MCQKECWRWNLVVGKNIGCLYPWTQRIRQPIKAAMTIKCNEGNDGGDRDSYKACKGTWSSLEVGESSYRESLSIICGGQKFTYVFEQRDCPGNPVVLICLGKYHTGPHWKTIKTMCSEHSFTHSLYKHWVPIYVTLCPRHWGYNSERNRQSWLPGAHVLPFVQGLRNRGVRRERS